MGGAVGGRRGRRSREKDGSAFCPPPSPRPAGRFLWKLPLRKDGEGHTARAKTRPGIGRGEIWRGGEKEMGQEWGKRQKWSSEGERPRREQRGWEIGPKRKTQGDKP